MTPQSVVSSQLLSDLLAPVSDQVSEHISDFSSMPCIRAHIKNSINSSSQVGAAPPPELAGLKCKNFTFISCLSILSPQAFIPSLLSSEASLTSSPLPGKIWGCEVKGQGEPETRRVDHCLILKRKRKSTVEDVDKGGPERNNKRSKSGEASSALTIDTLFYQQHYVSYFVLSCLWLEPTESQSSGFSDIMDPTDLDCSLCMRWDNVYSLINT